MTAQAAQAVVGRVATIAINDTAKLVPTADMVYAADTRWWNHNAGWALKYPSLLVTASASVPFSLVKFVQPNGREGYEPEPGFIRTGHNSGYQALHLAMQGGATRILLLGLDMTVEHGIHWHGKHPPGFSNPCAKLFNMAIPCFATLAKAAAVRNITIYNCSPISALTVFPKISLEEALGSD